CTHPEPPAAPSFGGTGTWAPRLPAAGRYEVLAFVPDLGAAAVARYAIDAADGSGPSAAAVDQNDFGSVWVSLGCHALRKGATVSLSSVAPDGDGASDLAYDAVAFVPAT